MKKKQVRLVLESLSDTRKIEALKEKVKDLEQAVEQIQIDFFDKMIELAEEEYGIDIKKKCTTKPSGGSGRTGKGTGTK